jgi:hypothetical protein
MARCRGSGVGLLGKELLPRNQWKYVDEQVSKEEARMRRLWVVLVVLVLVGTGANFALAQSSKVELQGKLQKLLQEGELAGARLDVAKARFEVVQEKMKALNVEITNAGFVLQQNPDGSFAVAEKPAEKK